MTPIRSQPSRVLAIGGTGTVGTHAVRELLARGMQVRVLTRSAKRAAHLPGSVEIATGDLLDPQAVRRAFGGVDAAFLLNAVGPTEAEEGLIAVNTAREADVRRLVYVSVQHADRAPHVPHFGSKIAVEAAIRGSGVPFTIVRPNSFFQNDLMARHAIFGGTYPQPLGSVGVSRVDVRDVAEAAAVALVEGTYEGRTIHVVGPEAHTGTSTAEGWARALGRAVAYADTDLNAWEQAMRQRVPAWLAFGLRLMFEHLHTVGMMATPEDVRLQTDLLGHAPRSFEAFARETAKQWRENTEGAGFS